MIKFLVYSGRGFANDKSMLAYESDKVGEHFEKKYGDFEISHHIDEKQARKYLRYGGQYAPSPRMDYCSVEDFEKYGGFYPSVDDKIQLMLIHSYQEYLQDKSYE
ncbi:hypothetical protein [Virgibacillus pantothenticus]|uniref:hypothetical protein n=1 Tax=Virgibacillus pantothenticus TaxID=1473 RepID=UPI0009876F9B|nr:hypothetical protein [Virgibacillus pantothenticus]